MTTTNSSTVNTGLYSHDIKAEIIAARDKEWMTWLLENLFRETDYGLEWQSTPRIALKRLAERKLEIMNQSYEEQLAERIRYNEIQDIKR